MNLLGSVRDLKSFIKPGLIALIPVFLGCDAANDAGTEFNLQTNIDVALTEFELESSNLFIDSLRTDGESKVLTGSYNDPITGRLTTEGYFQFKYSGGTLPVEQNSASVTDTLDFDSLYIILEPTDLIPFSQSGLLSFDVVELTDTLLNSIVYLGNKQEEFDRTIGSFEMTVNMEDDTLYLIKLNDSYGLELFNLVVNVARSTEEAIGSYKFKDLGLIPTSSSEAMALINTGSVNSQLRMYMSGLADSVYTAFFSIEGASYTHVDRSASTYGAFPEKQNFELTDGSNRTIMDPLAGVTTIFNIDELQTFFDDNPNILINTAILDFSNENTLSRDTLENFRLYFRKPDGGIFSPAIVQNPFSNIIMRDDGYLSAQNSPALGNYNIEKVKYSVSPTLFFQALYNNYQRLVDSEMPGALIYIDPFQSDTIQISDLVLINQIDVTLQQAVFNSTGIKLKIFYTEVN
ncbi:MAG: hypothetical protein RIM99_17315 [Cyclobacteriaceae bacterium]